MKSMEKIFSQLYNDIHSSIQSRKDPLKEFLFKTRQHILLVFYISSQPEKRTTLEDICYNISPKVVSRSTIQNILKEGCKINFLEKDVNEKDKREKFYKLTKEASALMENWAHNQNSIFSRVNDLIK
jgi:DNA-binding MarR family transcriptional regulator